MSGREPVNRRMCGGEEHCEQQSRKNEYQNGQNDSKASPFSFAVRQLLRKQDGDQSEDGCKQHRKEEGPAKADPPPGADKTYQHSDQGIGQYTEKNQ